MRVREITKADYDHIVEVSDHWWGGPVSMAAHPILYWELGTDSLLIEQDGAALGFLLGFITTQSRDAMPVGAPLGYVYLVGIHPDHRRIGVGRKLYDAFEVRCRERGCTRLKAVSAPNNGPSLDFHRAIGWSIREVEDYAGPSRKRIVFTKELVS